MADDRTPESYGLGLLTEECGELLEWIGKAGRFGPDTAGADGRTARERMQEEAGDVFAALAYLAARGVLDGDAMAERYRRKLDVLLDPGSRDLLGRRLAP